MPHLKVILHSVQGIKCTDTNLNHLEFIRDPTMHSRKILRKAKGDHLDCIHSDQMVLEIISRGRLVLVIGGQESQN
jgi:hypothetical protein